MYGGRDFRDDYKDTVERLALKDIFDDTGALISNIVTSIYVLLSTWINFY